MKKALVCVLLITLLAACLPGQAGSNLAQPGYPVETDTPDIRYPAAPASTQPTNTPVTPVTPTVSLPTITLMPTETPGLPPTPTATPTPNYTPTATPLPVEAGVPLPTQRLPINEANLDQLRPLAVWGRGRAVGLAWSPDGNKIALAASLGAYLYDSKLALLASLPTGAAASNPVFSPDSMLLAVSVTVTGSQGQTISTVQIWDTASSTLARSLPAPAEVVLLAFSVDGRALAVLTQLDRGQQKGGTLDLWDLSSSITQPARTVELIGGEVFQSAVINRDFTLAATHGETGAGPVRLWRLSDGVNFATTQETGEGADALAFSPDGKQLAVTYPDRKLDFTNTNEIRVWQIPDPQDVKPATLNFYLRDNTTQGGVELAEGQQQPMLNVAWSPDGQYLASGYGDRTVHVWRAVPSEAFRRMEGDTVPLGIAWSPDGTRIAAGGLEIFDLATGRRGDYSNDLIPGLYDLALSPDGERLAIAGYRQIEFRSTANGEPVAWISGEGSGITSAVNGISYSPNGKYLVAACDDGATRLYLTSNGTFLRTLGDPGQPVQTAVFSPDGKWIAVGSENMLIQVFRFLDGVLMLGLREPFVSYRLEFSPNTDQLASLTTSGVRLRSFGGELQNIDATLEGVVGGVGLSDMAYSPGQEWLAVVGNGVVRVIDPLTQATRYTFNDPNGVLPFAVAFSPDRAFLVVGWSDGSIRFYWAADGTPFRAINAHPMPVTRLLFSQDGTLLLSLGAEASLRVWGVTK